MNSPERQSLRASVIQMNSGHNVAENLKTAATLIAQAARENAELVVLPECFACLQGDLKTLGQNEVSDKRIQNFLSDQACTHNVTLVGGTTPYGMSLDGQVDGERNWATCFVYGSDGGQAARYDKIHLFDVDVEDAHGAYRESRDYHHGLHVVTCSLETGSVDTNADTALLGLSVCYDLRFPELYRQLSCEGADIITAPSAFTKVTGAAHWEVLVRARAIENQVFMLAANQCGTHGRGRETWGHSMIVGPDGVVLAEAGDVPGIIVADLNLQSLHTVRQAMPCLAHRRL